nr:MAG TPA: hypothetical protein [Caudoviricetes sp.]
METWQELRRSSIKKAAWARQPQHTHLRPACSCVGIACL